MVYILNIFHLNEVPYFLNHSEDWQGSVMLYAMVQLMNSECFENSFLPFRPSDLASDLCYTYPFHNALSLNR